MCAHLRRSPWRAEPLHQLAKWHALQLPACNGTAVCEAQHHLAAFSYARLVRRHAVFH